MPDEATVTLTKMELSTLIRVCAERRDGIHEESEAFPEVIMGIICTKLAEALAEADEAFEPED
jgi:hypothetical protein